MAIYHCSIKPISRGAGQSIVAAAAYRHACKLEDSRTGEVFDYSRKQGLESSILYFPSGVNPTWAQDRGELWNAAESAEKRKDARLGRELVLALPAELSPEQRCELVGEIARHLANRYGLAVDVAIHQPSRHGDERNHHVHILMSSRRITQDGFGAKARELDDKTSGPQEVESIRATWAGMANRALERAKQYVRIDHRSLKAQEIRRQPTVHLGVAASAMERRGITTRLGDRNRACIVAGKIAVRQWHEKWLKRHEEIQKEKEIIKTQSIVAKETREELEERLYGKTEKHKDISEIYAEARELYKKNLENKEKEEIERKRQELIAKRGYTDEQEKEYTTLVNEFENAQKLCIMEDVFNFRYDPEVLKTSLIIKYDFKHLSETKRSEEISNIENLLLLKNEEKQSYILNKVDCHNVYFDKMNIIKKYINFKSINAASKKINKDLADFDKQISKLEQEKEACVFLHKYYSIVETLKAYQLVKEKMEKHPVHDLKLKEKQQERERQRQEQQQGQYRGR